MLKKFPCRMTWAFCLLTRFQVHYTLYFCGRAGCFEPFDFGFQPKNKKRATFLEHIILKKQLIVPESE